MFCLVRKSAAPNGPLKGNVHLFMMWLLHFGILWTFWSLQCKTALTESQCAPSFPCDSLA
jgi:hypothetical protein